MSYFSIDSTGKIFLASLATYVGAKAFNNEAKRQREAREAADPIRHLPPDQRATAYTIRQFVREGDWRGFNAWLDASSTDAVPMEQRVQLWETFGGRG